MGNWINLDNALSMVGNLLLWLWTNGVSVSIGGITFDLPFGEIMLGVFLLCAAIDLIHAIILNKSSYTF